ncbi:hypothetical protein N7532_001522 [Penicillium argentinense]|uniref:Uncharacterized protein n=1 Tax=Penicillium argentinense TaxID=1131581 RepID=A0A9W9KMK4_9EURO|nr:uncharacterized protein N7532_001522 [Penicillium argentinense]KAJ5110987.1 hypothetical protein N7532_001522 [Penicillium argentinense]
MELAPQADTSCSSGKQWYVCSAGAYSGCCSIDPCADGICSDDNKSTKSKSTSSTTLTITPRKTTSATKSASEIASTTSSATTSTEIPTSTLSATSTIIATSTAVSTPSKISRHTGIIGGVVGGAAAAVILALLLCLCLRRKRRGKEINFHLHRSVSTASLKYREPTTATKQLPSAADESQPLTGTSRSLQNLLSSTTGSNATTAISSLDKIPANEQSLGSTVSSMTFSSRYLTNSATSTKSGPPITPPIRILVDRPTICSAPTLTPRAAGYVPELSDTGFRRQRVELATHSQSEMINQQHTRRQQRASHHRYHTSGSYPFGSSASVFPDSPNRFRYGDSGNDLIARQTAQKVVTEDGIVLGANLDLISSVDELRSKGKGAGEGYQGDHVMSFMDFSRDIELSERISGSTVGYRMPASESPRAGIPISRSTST